MSHIMLDIETLGVNPGCIVLSIGAAEIDKKGKIGKTFKGVIDIESSGNYGLCIEPRTLIWWMDQSEAARNLTFKGGIDLLEVLSQFNEAFEWKNKRVWCNGAAFDFPILKAVYNAIGHQTPWKYYDEMDFRTLKNMYKAVYERVKIAPVVAHDCLEDAIAQAKTLHVILKEIGAL